MRWLIRNAEVSGRIVDVLVEHHEVAAIGRGLRVRSDAEVVDAAAGALIPGLHDHHLHLMALAVHQRSIDVSGGIDLADALRSATGRRVRVVGYHEADGEHLDRHRLDALEPRRPVRVQHRTGGLWVLNSAALAEIDPIALEKAPPTDVELDLDGTPTGRLWRFDQHMRSPDPPSDAELDELGRRLAAFGLTALTDATPDVPNAVVTRLARLPQRLTFLGASAPVPDGVRLGPRKLLLRDHDLPVYDELRDMVRQAREEDRGVAVHCVTAASLALTLAVLDDCGRHPEDRIEHASVVPEPAALTGLRVVTQPSFIRDRGDDYLRELDSRDVPDLYRYRTLIDTGVEVLPSSDAPFGDVDPWSTVRAARDRVTVAGVTIGAQERLDPSTVLSGFYSFPAITPGCLADLCLLRTGLAEATTNPSAGFVRATWIAGTRIV